MYWYFKVLKQYADFSGRARRREYWMFGLAQFFIVVILFGLLASMTDGVVLKKIEVVWGEIFGFKLSKGYSFSAIFLSFIYLLATILPALAVTVRRLHDTGRSGLWIFIICIPLIGAIWFLILIVLDSQPGSNKYGSNPKGS